MEETKIDKADKIDMDMNEEMNMTKTESEEIVTPENAKKKKKKNESAGDYTRFFEAVYFLLLINTTAYAVLRTSAVDIMVYTRVWPYICIILETLIGVKVLYEWKNKWGAAECIMAVLGPVALLLCELHIDKISMMPFIFLILGARNIDGRKILKTYLYVSVAATLFVVIWALMGKVDNLVLYRDETSTHKRMALGFSYPTILTAHILTASTIWAYLRSEKIKWFEIIIIGGLGVFCYYIAEARIAAACILGIALVLLVGKICDIKKYKLKFFRLKPIKLCMIFCTSIFLALSFLIGWIYLITGSASFDHILSGRPLFNGMTMERYTLSPLGENMIFHGSFEQGMEGVPTGYYVINSSYLKFVYMFGIVGIISFIAMWTLLLYREVKKDNIRNALIFCAFCLFGFFETRMVQPEFDAFEFLILAGAEPILFFEFRFVNKQKIIKRIKSVVASFMLAVLTEMIVFNFKSVQTTLNMPLDAFSNQYFDTSVLEQVGENLFLCHENDVYLLNITDFGDEEITSVWFDMNIFDAEEMTLIPDAKFDIKFFDATNMKRQEDMVVLTSGTADCSNRGTTYFDVDYGKDCVARGLVFTVDAPVIIEFGNFVYNGPKPYNVNWLRVAAIFAVYLAGFVIYQKKVANSEEV